MVTNTSKKIIKAVIIGSGPTAYTAAIFLKNYNPILFEGEFSDGIGPGGQLTTTTKVDNYPGFPSGTMGPDLMKNMKKQALDLGIQIIGKFVISLKKEHGIFILKDKDTSYYAHSVVIATGASAKRLHVPGTDEFWTNGISACAVCDGAFFMDQECAVIGGGDTAMEESLFLSNICSKVYVIHRRNEFRARADKVERVMNTSNMKIMTPYVLKSAHGTDQLSSIKLENTETKEIMNLTLDGLFFGIGHTPNTDCLKSKDGQCIVELHSNGYVKTNRNMETSVEGLFACGDVQDFVYRQAITAASSGCIAAKKCEQYINKLIKPY